MRPWRQRRAAGCGAATAWPTSVAEGAVTTRTRGLQGRGVARGSAASQRGGEGLGAAGLTPAWRWGRSSSLSQGWRRPTPSSGSPAWREGHRSRTSSRRWAPATTPRLSPANQVVSAPALGVAGAASEAGCPARTGGAGVAGWPAAASPPGPRPTARCRHRTSWCGTPRWAFGSAEPSSSAWPALTWCSSTRSCLTRTRRGQAHPGRAWRASARSAACRRGPPPPAISRGRQPGRAA